jgi:hypothetical protein
LLKERENHFNNPSVRVFIGTPEPLTIVISETTTYAEDRTLTGQAIFEVPVIIHIGGKDPDTILTESNIT